MHGYNNAAEITHDPGSKYMALPEIISAHRTIRFLLFYNISVELERFRTLFQMFQIIWIHIIKSIKNKIQIDFVFKLMNFQIRYIVSMQNILLAQTVFILTESSFGIDNSYFYKTVLLRHVLQCLADRMLHWTSLIVNRRNKFEWKNLRNVLL